MSTAEPMRVAPRRAEQSLWYKDAIFYELRVRSMFDSNRDGIGDFNGLTEKLGYFRDLGVTTLWLLPFYPSPLRDDGYDISDYHSVHSDCGTLDDFTRFLERAHRLGLRVVTELVLNHTSDQHPWYQRARRAPPGSPERDFYVFSDTAERYREARVIFRDFEPSNWSWDPLARAYYWHRFYAHQPDLNFDNAEVRAAMLDVVDFWLGLGVDGLRLDAVPYLYEREGTSCENLPETYAFLRELRAHVDERFVDRMLLAEANQWPEDAVAYFDRGKACHMAFHFPIMPRLFMALRVEDRFPITDIWSETPPIESSCQWALFLRNHDELTLEMVTEEERDTMYRAYAQERRMRVNLGIRRRLAPLLGNNRRAIELMNALLFSLPGTPVLYYGDEIGMGDNVYLGDRDGVRTPMQWSGDLNAGFSRANPQQLILPIIIDYEFHYQTVNVEAQEKNRHSLLWWMRSLISVRKSYAAFGRGGIQFLNADNPRVLAFVRDYEDQRILVVANLSRFVQYVELDLSQWQGTVPLELLGKTRLPAVRASPYPLTLGPHLFLWLALEGEGGGSGLGQDASVRLEVDASASDLLFGDGRAQIEQVLPAWLPRRRFFAGKARAIKGAHFLESIRLPGASEGAGLHLVEIEYAQGDPEVYALPLALLGPEAFASLVAVDRDAIVCELSLREAGGERTLFLCDGLADPSVLRALLTSLEGSGPLEGAAGGSLVSSRSRAFGAVRGPSEERLEGRLLRADQSNSSVVYGDRMILKLFRKLEEGKNPDLELGERLTGLGFANAPPVAGAIEYLARGSEPRTIAIAHGFVPNHGNAWDYTCGELRRYFERAAAHREAFEVPHAHVVELATAADGPPTEALERVGAYLEAARLLGKRTAELHLALVDAPGTEFSPEPYTTLYRRSVYQSMRNLLARVFRLLRSRLGQLEDAPRSRAEALLGRARAIESTFEAFYRYPVGAMRMRYHGDLHLGQVLYTGQDFVFLDFEGEPARSLAHRRRKRSGLRDVAGMLRSFQYATRSVLRTGVPGASMGASGARSLEEAARFFEAWAGALYVSGYLGTANGAPFVPSSREELRVMLDAFLLEKAVYELGYELNHRPTWIEVPMDGIEELLDLRAARGDS